MALDERDRNFEKALERHLRPGAHSENSANLPGSAGASDDACPDAEILAAYHERGLSQEELISRKTHIAGCARCQELLRQLELTDEIPVNAEVVRAHHPASLDGTIAAAATAPAPSSKLDAVRAVRRTRLRWIAPAGAIAAGLLVWIALRENKTLPSPAVQSVEMADKLTPPPASASPQPASPKKEDEALDRKNRLTSAPAQPPKEKDSFAKASSAADLPLQGRNKQELQSLRPPGAVVGGVPSANQNNAPLDSSGAARGLPKTESTQARGASQSVELQSSNQQIATTAEAPSAPLPEQNQLTTSGFSPSHSADAINQTVENQVVGATEARSFSDPTALKKVRASARRDARLATTPSGDVVWRVGLEGQIEKSADGGKTFKKQESGVKSELVAASAPDNSVCWVVGRSGTILLTADGGTHWTKAVSPVQGNIGGVHAEDGLHATIWDVANRTIFRTSDGGTTWTRVANE